MPSPASYAEPRQLGKSLPNDLTHEHEPAIDNPSGAN